ncbi:hypothetical protein L593_14940 [Salinarchaeum sp. Harcht-Bsk1]|nr:hypothetical protein L593_14940 [Salinarchaeum sp. Harcht-Bsk1]
MGRTLGLFAVLLGTSVVLVSHAGVVEGSFAHEAGWQRFIGAIGGTLVGIGIITWGGTKYAGVGARI